VSPLEAVIRDVTSLWLILIEYPESGKRVQEFPDLEFRDKIGS